VSDGLFGLIEHVCDRHVYLQTLYNKMCAKKYKRYIYSTITYVCKWQLLTHVIMSF